MATLIIECDNSVAISFFISSIFFSDLSSFSFPFLSFQLSTLHSQLLQLPSDFRLFVCFQIFVCTTEMFVSEETVVSGKG